VAGTGPVRSPRLPTLTEAKEWQRRQAHGALARRLSGPKPTITLAAAWRTWHEKATAGVIVTRSGGPYKPSTLRDYATAMDRRVIPDYGGNPMADVTPAGLKQLRGDLQASRLSPSAVRNVFNPLRALYRDADQIVEGGVGEDPTAGLRLPPVVSRREADRIPDPGQARKLVAAAPARDRAIWAAACFAGLRRGELRALRWRDVDFAAGELRVRRSWDRVAGAIEPKSEQGRREVPIFDGLRAHLGAHRDAAADPAPDALVFATRTGGPFDPSDVSRRAARAWRATEVEPFTLHEGRHGFASICVEAGVNAKRLQTWMGHSSVATTYDLYGKLLDRSEAESIERVNRYLVGPFVGPSRAARSGFGRSAAPRAPAGADAGRGR